MAIYQIIWVNLLGAVVPNEILESVSGLGRVTEMQRLNPDKKVSEDNLEGYSV